MKKKTFVLTLLIMSLGFMAALAMIGCQNILWDKNNSLPENSADSSLPEGYGAIRVSLVRGAARTAIPTAELDAFQFEYLFSKYDEAANEYKVIEPLISGTAEFLLEEGSYFLEVKAYHEESLVASGGTEFILEAGATKDVPITLQPVSDDGVGTLEFTLTYNDTAAVEVESFTLTEIFNEINVININNVIFSSNTYTGNEYDIPAGYYLLQLTLRKGVSPDAYSFAVKTQVVHIYKGLTTNVNYSFSSGDFISNVVTNTDNSGTGSLRYAIQNAQPGATIRVMLPVGSVIKLSNKLVIDKSLTIEGNGLKLTPGEIWSNTSMLEISGGSSVEVKISRVHFDNGVAPNSGAAINNKGGTITLESCIFSNNKLIDTYMSGNITVNSGGAICSVGAMYVYGCTFYNNDAGIYNGGAIFNNNTNFTLAGNLFYKNRASQSPVVGSMLPDSITSLGYNLVDIPLGSGGYQCGWNPVAEDSYNTALPFSPASFRLLPQSAAVNAITGLPSGIEYPRRDFYGNAIPQNNASIGAVQERIYSGFYIDVVESELYSVDISGTQDNEEMYTGAVTLTINVQPDYELVHWLVNGVIHDNSGPTLQLTDLSQGYNKIEAVLSPIDEIDTWEQLNNTIQSASGSIIIPLDTPSLDATSTIEISGGRTITLIASDTVTISRELTFNAALFNVVDGGALILGTEVMAGSITINGALPSGTFATASLIQVNNGGSLEMNENVTLTSNEVSSSDSANGGGVYVNGGTFTMSGGTISGNEVSSSDSANGGGVYVNGGTFTMNGGTIFGNDADDSGGGVYIYNGTFIMEGGEISGNNAANYGGGVTANGNSQSAQFIIKDGAISGNTARYGGGLCLFEGIFTMSGGIIGGTTDSGNTVIASGGGVYIFGGTFEMSDTATISGNKATKGGGVYVNSTGTFTMEGGTIGGTTDSGNTAENGGGGVYVENGTFTMSGGTISGNMAAPGGDGGGGVYASGGTFTMKGGTISDNNALMGYGGGVYVDGGGIFTMEGGQIELNNADVFGGGVYVVGSAGTFTMSGDAVISGNTATGNGGGVYVNSNGTFTMQGGTISGNQSNNQGGGVYVGGTGTFKITTGIVYGTNDNALKNTALSGGTAVYANSIVLLYPGGIENEEDQLDFPYIDNTINVVNGALQ